MCAVIAVLSDQTEDRGVHGVNSAFSVPAKISKTVYDVGYKNLLDAEFISRQTKVPPHTVHSRAQAAKWWQCSCGHEVRADQLRCPLPWCRLPKQGVAYDY